MTKCNPELTRFKEKSHFTAWKTEECNRVQGGEGGFFPPNIEEKTVLGVFVSPMCRNMKLTFDRWVEAAGLQAMRFRPDPNLFDYDAFENWNYMANLKHASDGTLWLEYPITLIFTEKQNVVNNPLLGIMCMTLCVFWVLQNRIIFTLQCWAVSPEPFLHPSSRILLEL